MVKKLNLRGKIYPLALVGAITLTTLSDCSQKKTCDIDYNHVHKYINKEGFCAFRNSESEYEGDMRWTEDILMTCMADEYQKEIDQFNFLKIEDNKTVLEKVTKNDLPYIEYEYAHTESIDDRKYCVRDFTKDSKHQDLTGYVRDVSYQYRGYKIIKGKDGDLQVFSSKLVDNLSDIKDEYPYFNLDDYKQKVYSEKYKRAKVKVKK